jgi:dipeptidyl aminopeptidase/acylaminoacyl peptidase
MPRFAPLAVVCMTAAVGSAQVGYRKPPPPVDAILDAPPPPAVSVSPTRDYLALVQGSRYPSVADLAEPTLRLAGVRLNPRTNGPARPPRVTGISFQKLPDGQPVAVKLPDGKPGTPLWSPDGKRFAFTNTTPTGIELWVGEVANPAAPRKLADKLSAAVGEPVQWIDGEKLLAQLVPEGRGEPPAAPTAPAGPVVQEAGGSAAPVRTYQDLLKDAHDEALFEHYATSVLGIYSTDSGGPVWVGDRKAMLALYTSADPSPDGKYLLTTRLKKPFSYLYPASAFPKVVEVRELASGKVVRTVADLPLQDTVPIEGVPVGPRAVQWRQDRPATLAWVEALDGGDPKRTVPHRDQLVTLAAPFAGEPARGLKLQHRFAGLSYFEAGDRALVRDLDRDRRWQRGMLADIAKPDAEPAVLFDRSVNDRYGDPGTPLSRTTADGRRVLRTTPAGELLLSRAGATPKGEFPELTAFNPATKQTRLLFRCRPGMYEQVVTPLDDDAKTLLVRRESPSDPGNYFLRAGDNETQLTTNADPYPELRRVKKQLLVAKRADGVDVPFTLYLPPDAEPGKRLPAVFWAYPREFNDAATAGQVSGSPNRFVTLTGYSHLFLLTQGYAVLDEVNMPIVGKPESANDTFVEQLVMTAKAAIDKACEAGPIDRDRIGVGGHSYGAFMTANLLAHSDLFRAGIARSGAYNRTLTPFGFQNERRTFWEAPQVYGRMSPFYHADKIKAPLLLVHGQADSNPGTFPVQSERLYQAVRGTGGTVRLVLLPHEDHGYAGRESVGHVLAEHIGWFDAHVKNAPPRPSKPGVGGD